MTRRVTVRRSSRRSLLWKVFYGSGELAGEGTILDMNENGYRIAGCMPVEPGTKLRVCIWPNHSPKDIMVAQGTVKWSKGLVFGLVLEMATSESLTGELEVGIWSARF